MAFASLVLKRAGHLMVGLLAAGFLVCSGCHKSETTTGAEINGVTVDIAKLSQSFVNSSEQLKQTVTQVGLNVRYTKYEDALMTLDKLVNDPSITADQKKIVNQVIEQVKKLAGSQPAPAQ
jgi:hypothetical protein